VDRVLDNFGRVDIVVNNAGVYFTGRIDEPDSGPSGV
jgi:NAD(P)-dependent dehydrogenase (short-subunit alcohol dehydrogenase family)